MSIMPAALIDMCRMTSCDASSAKALLSDVDVNARFIANTPDMKIAYLTTLLAEAVQAGNLDMVKLLLQHGADPNLIPEDEPILFMLEYPEDEEPSLCDEQRLAIVELLLQSGADPLVKYESVSILDDACSDVFNTVTGYCCAYMKRFLLLLILYGGTSDYCNVRFYQSPDLNNTLQYHMFLIQRNDGFLYGEIRDDSGNIVAHF